MEPNVSYKTGVVNFMSFLVCLRFRSFSRSIIFTIFLLTSILLRLCQLLSLVLSHLCSLLFFQAFLLNSTLSVIKQLPQLYLELLWVTLSLPPGFNVHCSVKACAADFIKKVCKVSIFHWQVMLAFLTKPYLWSISVLEKRIFAPSTQVNGTAEVPDSLEEPVAKERRNLKLISSPLSVSASPIMLSLGSWFKDSFL